MGIDNARLPTTVEVGAIGGPQFKTTILIAASGNEQRIVEWDLARCEWDIGYGIKGKEDRLYVISFFRAVMGRAFAWRFKDWSDYQATASPFGTGDGTTVNFQLKKTYSSLSDSSSVVRSYVRNIVLPRASPLTIFDNAVPVSASDYTMLDGGIVQFDTPPLDTHALTWTGEFDVPVRFDVDKLPMSMATDELGSVRGLRIVEVLDDA